MKKSKEKHIYQIPIAGLINVFLRYDFSVRRYTSNHKSTRLESIVCRSAIDFLQQKKANKDYDELIVVKSNNIEKEINITFFIELDENDKEITYIDLNHYSNYEGTYLDGILEQIRWYIRHNTKAR